MLDSQKQKHPTKDDRTQRTYIQIEARKETPSKQRSSTMVQNEDRKQDQLELQEKTLEEKKDAHVNSLFSKYCSGT